jgi:hypothetical protein
MACRLETASIRINGGATSSNRQNRSNPPGFAAAAIATFASMTNSLGESKVQAKEVDHPLDTSLLRRLHPLA